MKAVSWIGLFVMMVCVMTFATPPVVMAILLGFAHTLGFAEATWRARWPE